MGPHMSVALIATSSTILLLACAERPRLSDLVPLTPDGALLFAERKESGLFVAVDAKEERWRFETNDLPLSPDVGRWAVTTDDLVVVLVRGEVGTRLIGLNRLTGAQTFEVLVDPEPRAGADDVRFGGLWAASAEGIIATAPSERGTSISLHEVPLGLRRWQTTVPAPQDALHQLFVGTRRIAFTTVSQTLILDRETGAQVAAVQSRGVSCLVGTKVVVVEAKGAFLWDLDTETVGTLNVPALAELGAVQQCGVTGRLDDWLALWGPSPALTLTRVSLSDSQLKWKVTFDGATMPTHSARRGVSPLDRLGVSGRFVLLALSGSQADTGWRSLVAVDVDAGHIVTSRQWAASDRERWLVLAFQDGILGYELDTRTLYTMNPSTGELSQLSTLNGLREPRATDVSPPNLWVMRPDASVEPGAWRTMPMRAP